MNVFNKHLFGDGMSQGLRRLGECNKCVRQKKKSKNESQRHFKKYAAIIMTTGVTLEKVVRRLES